MKNPWLNLAYLGLLWIWVVSAAWRDWRDNPDYSYGFVVLPLAVYFAIQRIRATPPSLPAHRPAVWIFLLFFPALLALPLELLNLSPLHWRLVSWLVFFGAAVGTCAAAYLLGGRNWLVTVLFPLLLASTAIPWPTAIEQLTGNALLPWLTETTSDLLRFGGIPVQRQGFLLILPNCVVGIEQACSGLRSLQASFMVALAAGEIMALPLGRRLLLVALAPIIALGFNLARTLTLSLAGFHGGTSAAHAWHDPSGLAAMGLGTLVLLGAAYLLRPQSSPSPSSHASFETPYQLPLAAPILLVAGLLTAHLWYGWNEAATPIEAPSLVLRDGDGTSLPLPADLAAILHPDFGGYFRKFVSENGPLTGYHFFWKSSPTTANQLYHRPDVCMPGAGWKLLPPPVPFTATLSGRLTHWQILEYDREGIRATLLWGGWLNHQPVNLALGATSSLQTQIMGQLIRTGTRELSYEVAAVLLPFKGRPLSATQAAAIVEQLFKWNENPARR